MEFDLWCVTMKKIKIISALFTALSIMFVMSVSQATTLSFNNITNNTGTDLSDQISVVSTSVTGGVEFKFTNNVGIASSITDIYFDVGDNSTLFSGFEILTAADKTSSGVSYDLAPHPTDLPGGNTVGFTSDFGGDSTAPQTSANGVNASDEYITFLLTLGTGFDYDDYLAELMNGTFRIGMHIQAIAGIDCSESRDPECGSDSYVNVSAVPVPAAAWLFGTALIGFFATSRRKNIS